MPQASFEEIFLVSTTTAGVLVTFFVNAIVGYIKKLKKTFEYSSHLALQYKFYQVE